MPIKLNLKNRKIYNLTVLCEGKRRKKRITWDCICDCGTIHNVIGTDLNTGNIRSCGCLQKKMASIKNKTHGLSNTRFYDIWNQMIQRCNNKKSKGYYNYGARGINVCKKWYIFENFRDDMYKDYLEHVKKFNRKNTTLDRINNDREYSFENCEWTTRKKQNRNKRNNILITFNGVTDNPAGWEDRTGIKQSTIRKRFHKQYRVNDILKKVNNKE